MPIKMTFNMTDAAASNLLYLGACFETNERSILELVSTRLIYSSMIIPKHASWFCYDI